MCVLTLKISMKNSETQYNWKGEKTQTSSCFKTKKPSKMEDFAYIMGKKLLFFVFQRICIHHVRSIFSTIVYRISCNDNCICAYSFGVVPHLIFDRFLA